ncbi:hypothetical protein Tco_1431172 [Tanacetum coccineum]
MYLSCLTRQIQDITIVKDGSRHNMYLSVNTADSRYIFLQKMAGLTVSIYEPNGIEDKSVAMDSNSNLESRSSVTISSRSCVLQACTTTSGFIALAGVVIRQLPQNPCQSLRLKKLPLSVRNMINIGRANRILSIEEDTTRIMTKIILNKRMENAQAESSLAKSNTDDDMNIELNKEFLMELRSNAYHGMFDEDVVDHIPKMKEMAKSPLGKNLLRNFSVNSIPYPANGEDEMLEEDDSWGLIHLNSYPDWNKEPINDIVSSDEEWEESNYGNPPNTTTDSFFKPYLGTHDIEKVDERSQKRHKGNDSKLEINILNKATKSDNKNNEQPNKRDLAGKKSTNVVKYQQSGILAHEINNGESTEQNIRGVSLDFEIWHLQLIAGLVILISSSRFLLLKTWSDFVEFCEASNQLVVTSLEPLDYAFVAFLPDIIAALFGILHLGSGRKFSFATWATFDELAYGYAMILTSSLIVHMASHAIINLIGVVIWRINHQKRELIYKEGAMMIDPSKTS